ncbi:hypothetical protein [Kitasatospora sp. CB01950]|uniref:hypothetical protein n=1 Tax=Kitasatospora sp. CB01950 TaxID=1703930 RepID=UPI0009396CAB|nr:hypothetical protein [Kitasatospora sp. CB01950]OKJ14058.1 hypothetical protein AMK19_10315 [Kitasatospora sp. CB01950]
MEPDQVTTAVLAGQAATTVVTLLATDAWEGAKTAVAGAWRRLRPERAESIEQELDDTREDVLRARADGTEDETLTALAGDWERRFRRLIGDNPALAAEIRRVLDEELTPALPPEQRAAGGTVFHATVTNGNVYQAGRDQNFHG